MPQGNSQGMTVAWSWMTDFIFPRVMRQVLVTTEKDRVEVEKHRSRKAEKQRSRKSKTQKSREAEKREPRKAEKQKSTETGKAGKVKKRRNRKAEKQETQTAEKQKSTETVKAGKVKKTENQKGREAGCSNSGEADKQRSRNQTKPYQNLIPKINSLPLTIPKFH
jgi:hypothetical protein